MREKIILPDKDAVFKAAEVGKPSIEGAEYVEQQYKQLVKAAKKEVEASTVLNALSEYVQLVKFTLGSQEGIWNGIVRAPSTFKNMYQNMADSVGKELSDVLKDDVKLNIAFNDLSQLVRGYLVGDKPASPEEVKLLDTLFNSWLALNADTINKSSTLFDANEKGGMKTDAHGKQVKANVDKIKQLINDPMKGFGKFVEDRLKSNGSEKEMDIALQEFPQTTIKSEAEARQPIAASAAEMTEDLSLDEHVEPQQDQSRQMPS